MPFFSSKFSPKKPPERKNLLSLKSKAVEELVSEDRKVRLRLGPQEFTFDDGAWTPATGTNSNIHQINKQQEDRIMELQEENNILRIKYEILLNMLTQATAESHIQQREIEKLRRVK